MIVRELVRYLVCLNSDLEVYIDDSSEGLLPLEIADLSDIVTGEQEQDDLIPYDEELFPMIANWFELSPERFSSSKALILKHALSGE